MKSIVCIILITVLSSCGKKDQPPPAAGKSAPEKKTAPTPVVAPQGKLPKMDPEKAKFIAVPSTPKDAEPKKDEKAKDEVKKGDKPAVEAKK